MAKTGRRVLTIGSIQTFSFPKRGAVAAEETNWGRELSSFVVRAGAGVLMVHNGLDKLVDPEVRDHDPSLVFAEASATRPVSKRRGVTRRNLTTMI